MTLLIKQIMADSTTKHANSKRGGARPNAGRHRVYGPGKQSSLWLGAGEEPKRILCLFKKEMKRSGFKHNSKFLAHLLHTGTAQQAEDLFSLSNIHSAEGFVLIMRLCLRL